MGLSINNTNTEIQKLIDDKKVSESALRDIFNRLDILDSGSKTVLYSKYDISDLHVQGVSRHL